MKIIEAGHIYLLDSIDGGEPQRLEFVKREGDNFPFNSGAHPGTNVQEVLRALEDRTHYLWRQKPCAETEAAWYALKIALWAYEDRAARRHGRHLDLKEIHELVNGTTCKTCGHIGCEGHA